MPVRVLCIGGGSGVTRAVLEPLSTLKKKIEIYTLTSMVDNGGSTGALRRELDVLPPGDIRRHLITLADCEEWKKKIWNLRFARDIEFPGGHRGHSFANVFIAGLEYTLGDFEEALEVVHEFLHVRGVCLPATLDKVQLVARLENGEVVEGEDEIDVPKQHDPEHRIVDVWLEPEARAYPLAIQAIQDANYILVGPGDLYSSLIPCLLPHGIREALQESTAKKIFIAPAMTKKGETHWMSIEDMLMEIEKYAGTGFDYALYNTTMPSQERLEAQKREEPLWVDMAKPRNPDSPRIVGRDLLLDQGPIAYDPNKMLPILKRILGLGE